MSMVRLSEASVVCSVNAVEMPNAELFTAACLAMAADDLKMPEEHSALNSAGTYGRFDNR